MSKKQKSRQVRACLITSARSGSGHVGVPDVLSVLLTQGWDVAVREKREKGEATHLARQAAEDGYDPIVNCGGDGTLNEIVQALAGTDIAVGTIPGGTENVWSKQIGISPRPRVAAMQLVASERARVDVGWAEINGKHRQAFLMMAGLGADGAVMTRVSRTLKNRIGPLAVAAAALEALPSIGPVPLRIDLDGMLWEGASTEIVVGNIRDYGGFTHLTPDAYVDDGMLDVCLFTTDGVLPAGRQLASMFIRRQPSPSSSEMYRVPRISVRSSTCLPLQLDGSSVDHGLDVVDGEIEYRFFVEPRALTVAVPRTYDGAIFEHGLSLNGSSGKNGKHKHKKHR